MNDSNDDTHGFTRVVDPHFNNLDVDLPAVHALIQKRALARSNQDYYKADTILSQLLSEHSVIINDSNKTWKTGTKREIKKRPKQQKSRRPFGARAGYQLCKDAGPHTSHLSQEEIQDYIVERRFAQKTRNYTAADRIRNTLKKAGVYLQDGLQQWRADGVPFGNPNGDGSSRHRGYSSSSSSSLPTRMVRSEYSLALTPDKEKDEPLIEKLLAERSQSQASGDFAKADYTRDRLFEKYNIRIDDRLGEWSVGGDFGDDFNSDWAKASSRLGYVKSASSVDLPTLEDEEYVQRKVDERMRAKRTRNYDLSDAIRDELFADWDVTIHDKINEWSVGGEFGRGQSWTHVEPFKYTPREGDTTLSQEDMRTINSLIDRRVKARRDRNFNQSDGIKAHLSKTYGISIDDQAREWSIADGEEEGDDDAKEELVIEGNHESSIGNGNSQGDRESASLPQEEEELPAASAALSKKKELSGLTVLQLKERLRNAGQKVSGKKEELIDRLLA